MNFLLEKSGYLLIYQIKLAYFFSFTSLKTMEN